MLPAKALINCKFCNLQCRTPLKSAVIIRDKGGRAERDKTGKILYAACFFYKNVSCTKPYCVITRGA